MEKSTVTWEQIVEKFREEYVPLVERDRLAQEFLSLKKTTEMVMEITKMQEESLILPRVCILRISEYI